MTGSSSRAGARCGARLDTSIEAAAPRVALVHDWLTGMRGGEKVLEAIAERFPSAPIFTLLRVPGALAPALEKRVIHASFLQRAPGVRRWYRHYLPLFPTAIESFDFSGFDLIISSSHCAAKGAIPGPGGFHVCYCHTPMRYAWDQEAAYFPKRTGLVARVRGVLLSRLRTWDVAACSRVDLFAANSTFVAERIRRYYGRRAEVVPPPVDIDFFTPAAPPPGGGGRYLLSVAALSPYKRHEVAIEAARRSGIELRIVGDGPLARELRRCAAGAPVRLLGRVEGEALRDLYRGALAFVQPAMEDFGIAAVEALACGTPVVAAAGGGVNDIVVDGEHGLLYPPEGGAEALAGAIDKSCRLGFNKLNLRRRAERFSGERFHQRFQELLDRGLPDSLRRRLDAGDGRRSVSLEGANQ